MTLAEAHALCSAIQHVEHQPAADLQGLERFARWMMRFSPLVEMKPPDGVALDVSGSARLFGSFERLLQLTTTAVSRLGFHHGIAIAPTLGAAWALASFGIGNGQIIVESVQEAINPLPVAALRLEDELIETLASLGIQTIEQLACLPRETLPARFGASMLLRLDQAMGIVDEPLVGIKHREPIRAAIEFEASIDSLEMIEEGLRILVGRIVSQLQQHGCGARKLIVECVPFRAPPIQNTIHLSRPTASPTALMRLLRCATESAKAGEGFVGLRLSAPVYERISPTQVGLLDGEEERSADEYEHLLERLRARMGEGAVLRPCLAESHLPERSCVYVEALSNSPPAMASPVLEQHQTKSRPLHLLSVPRELRCMVSPGGAPISFVDDGVAFNLSQVRGPERITGVWWEGRDKTRDYFDVEDSTGRRFWIFRVPQNRRWFLHGIFDC